MNLSESGCPGFKDLQDCDCLIFCLHQDLQILYHYLIYIYPLFVNKKSSCTSSNPGYPDSDKKTENQTRNLNITS